MRGTYVEIVSRFKVVVELNNVLVPGGYTLENGNLVADHVLAALVMSVGHGERIQASHTLRKALLRTLHA